MREAVHAVAIAHTEHAPAKASAEVATPITIATRPAVTPKRVTVPAAQPAPVAPLPAKPIAPLIVAAPVVEPQVAVARMPEPAFVEKAAASPAAEPTATVAALPNTAKPGLVASATTVMGTAVLSAMQQQVAHAVDYVQALAGTRTLAEAASVQADHAARQIAVLHEQIKVWSDATGDVVARSLSPFRDKP